MHSQSHKNEDKDRIESSKSSESRSPVQRSKLACLLCRRKKVRCNGAQPTCSNCAKRGCRCVYSEGKKRGRPPRNYKLEDLAPVGQLLPPPLKSLIDAHGNVALTDLAVVEKPRPPKLEGLLNDKDVEVYPRMRPRDQGTSAHIRGSGVGYGLW
ncbi:hypothetical protein LPJ73_004477 [Coemansia sp. RSA 2703]|nr:hypothetical protein LPJ73_004477 [Coemansia sp. RSA 2703]KAJ2366857.1 hypothetical protein IW150_005830 [Coemansia sp. RSA 2607]KAJ2393479.1 hypothetical protein GGI05_002418 [Coemansia sp. RSA 2603]